MPIGIGTIESKEQLDCRLVYSRADGMPNSLESYGRTWLVSEYGGIYEVNEMLKAPRRGKVR